MSSATFASICCLVAHDGWKHLVKVDGALERHVWWAKTADGFALGVFAAFDVAGPLFWWKVRAPQGTEVEGGCGSMSQGCDAAVLTQERWAAEMRERRQKPRAMKFTPVEDSTIPF